MTVFWCEESVQGSMNTLLYALYLTRMYFRGTSIYHRRKRNIYTCIKQTSKMNLYATYIFKMISVLVKVSLQYLHYILLKGINILIETVNGFTASNSICQFDWSHQWSQHTAASTWTRPVSYTHLMTLYLHCLIIK